MRAHKGRGVNKYQAHDNSLSNNEILPRVVTGELPDRVSDTEVVLIADIHGLLVQLEPLDKPVADEIEALCRKQEGRELEFHL